MCSLGSYLYYKNTAKNGSNIGASGATSACVAAMACAYPFDRVMIYGIIPAPLFATAGLFFLYDLYQARTQYAKSGGTNSIGHVAGALTGVVFWYLKMRRRFY